MAPLSTLPATPYLERYRFFNLTEIPTSSSPATLRYAQLPKLVPFLPITRRHSSAGEANARNTTAIRYQVCRRRGQSREVLSRCARSHREVRVAGLERVRDGRHHSRSAPGFRQEPGRKGRTGFSLSPM